MEIMIDHDGIPHRLNPDEPAPDLDPEQHFGHEPEMHTDEEWAQIRDAMDGAKPDPMGDAPLSYRLRAMGAVRSKRTDGEVVEWVNAPLAVVVTEAYRAAEAVTDAEEHTHYTRDARDQCAAGDHRYAVLLDNAAKREKIAAHEVEVTTMAEEPIENRLRRAWLNGFKDGVERAAYATTESTGRWDY